LALTVRQRIGRERLRFLDAVRSKAGTLYKWSANGPLYFDCSGLVIWGLRHTKRFAKIPDMNTDGLRHHFRACETHWEDAQPGSIVLYGPSRTDMDHVMILNWRWGPGRYGLIGMCSGGGGTNSIEVAYGQDARMKTPRGSYMARRRQSVLDPFHMLEVEHFFSGGPHA